MVPRFNDCSTSQRSARYSLGTAVWSISEIPTRSPNRHSPPMEWTTTESTDAHTAAATRSTVCSPGRAKRPKPVAISSRTPRSNCTATEQQDVPTSPGGPGYSHPGRPGTYDQWTGCSRASTPTPLSEPPRAGSSPNESWNPSGREQPVGDNDPTTVQVQQASPRLRPNPPNSPCLL